MQRDLVSLLGVGSSLLPAVRTADETGTGVSLADAYAAEAIFHCGEPGDTLSGSVYIEAKLMESNDDISYTAVANADMQAPAGVTLGTDGTGVFALIDANGEASSVSKVGYIGSKKYIAVRHEVTGTHTNGTPTSAVILTKAKHLAVGDAPSLA